MSKPPGRSPPISECASNRVDEQSYNEFKVRPLITDFDCYTGQFNQLKALRNEHVCPTRVTQPPTYNAGIRGENFIGQNSPQNRYQGATTPYPYGSYPASGYPYGTYFRNLHSSTGYPKNVSPQQHSTWQPSPLRQSTSAQDFTAATNKSQAPVTPTSNSHRTSHNVTQPIAVNYTPSVPAIPRHTATERSKTPHRGSRGRNSNRRSRASRGLQHQKNQSYLHAIGSSWWRPSAPVSSPGQMVSDASVNRYGISTDGASGVRASGAASDIAAARFGGLEAIARAHFEPRPTPHCSGTDVDPTPTSRSEILSRRNTPIRFQTLCSDTTTVRTRGTSPQVHPINKPDRTSSANESSDDGSYESLLRDSVPDDGTNAEGYTPTPIARPRSIE